MQPPATDEVLIRREGRAGRITMNRPKALNALTHAMVGRIWDALVAWRNDPGVELVLLDGAGERGLCAGGDVRSLYDSRAQGSAYARSFWSEEYRLNALIGRYPKPFVAIQDGIVMGGGIGLSGHASHRVVTERSQLAMPETGIGLIPDVGGTWLLARAPGETGTYLGLTGETMRAADAIYARFSDLHIPSSKLGLLTERLVDPAGGAAQGVLRDLAEPAGPSELERRRADIDRVFGAASVEAILEALAVMGGEWAEKTMATLQQKSPKSSKLALAAIRNARRLRSLEEALAVEYRLTVRLFEDGEFPEGVRALIIDKDRKPRWSPPDLAGVTPELVTRYLAPLPATEELTFEGDARMTGSQHKGPLQGMRVLDLSHVMAGPVCGLMLADMGADVVKIERIPIGDDSRQMTTPSIGGESAAFMMMNRNKRGLALDLKKPKGQEVLRRLVKTADALIENYRKGTMEKFGLGYDSLKAINPGLVYCEISGFGRTGPLAGQGGFDLVAQGMSGLMAITGEGPGRPPVKVGAPITDITAGLLAAMGVAAAYAHKLKTGEGQRVDTSLFEAGIIQTYWQSAIALATGVSPGPLGSGHPLTAPYQAFQTSDGWITLGASNQKTWLQFIEALDAPDIAGDPRFADNSGRMANLPALIAALEPHFARRTTAEWLAQLARAGVPAGPVLSIGEMHAHPQTKARNMVPVVEHGVAGRVETIGLPVKFSGTPGAVARGAPVYGEHTRELLNEASYKASEIDELLREAVVAEPSQPRDAGNA